MAGAAGYLAVALKLEGRRCVVVGAGAVAARRADALLEAGAQVVVVAPEACARIHELAAAGALEYRAATYTPEALDGAFLVVAAADRPEVNAAVGADCRARGILFNDAEAAERGDLIVCASVRRGDLLLAATTCGASPALAARIRDELAARYGPEYGALTALLAEARGVAMTAIPNAASRRRALRAAAEDEAVLALLREGRADEARARVLDCISSASD